MTVTDVNDTHQSITSNSSISFAENNTSAVTTITSSDTDFGDTAAYSISGEDADVQAICNAAWTTLVKEDLKAKLIANKSTFKQIEFPK